MRRVRYALTALVLAAVLITQTGWSPLCVLYDRWDPMWYFLACWDGPPNPPEG